MKIFWCNLIRVPPFRSVIFIGVILTAVACLPCRFAYSATQVNQFGITWTFDRDYETGQFANGDYWVVGPVTIIAITRPAGSAERDGSMVNPIPSKAHGYDSRVSDGYDPILNVANSLPLTVNPDKSLISTISDLDSSRPVLKTAAVLTVLRDVPPVRSFRPPYAGNDKPLYSTNDLKRELLLSLEPVENTPSLSSVERLFERPWIDHRTGWQGDYLHPGENMENYGAGMARDSGIGVLRLLLNDAIEDKETLLIRYVQLGIDNFGLVKNGAGWGNVGGSIGVGRKIPILFAGYILANTEMKNVAADYDTRLAFQEDGQTFYLTQAERDATYHPDNCAAGSDYCHEGYYDNDPFGTPEWGERHYKWLTESYNYLPGKLSYLGITHKSTTGAALAVHLLGIEELWNYSPFLDWTDRCKNEGVTGTWGSAFADAMWDTYRADYGPVWPDTDDIPPLAPTNLVSTSQTESTISLAWDAPPAASDGDVASAYRVHRNSAQVGQVSNTAFQDTGLDPGTSYSYEVFSLDDAGNLSESAAAGTFSTTADNSPPSIASVSASKTSLQVAFSESLDPISAEDSTNYSIDNGIAVTAASLGAYPNIVVLTTTAHADGITYTLTVSNVRDVAGNAIGQAATTYNYDDGLVGYWKFDEGSGTTTQDSSGNSNTATLVNGPTWTTGKVNGGLSFDGIDDAVQIGTSGLDATSGTIVLWSYAADFSSGTPHYLFSHAIQPWSNRIQLYTDDAEGYLDLGLGDSHATHADIANLDADSWYHVALSWDGADYVVYIDGTAKAKGTYTGLSSLETYADIGNNGSTTDRIEAFNGIIDEVRVYTRALTSDEVLTLYDSEAGSTNQTPVLSTIGNQSVNENEDLAFTVNATDADGDTITYSAQNLPSGASFGNQSFSWTPGYDQAGSYQVTFAASDGRAQDSETITITVNNVDRPPVLAAIGDKSVDENSTLTFSVSASDADGDNITYSVESLPSGATFASPFTWTPDYTQAGTYEVTFTASDGQAQDSETITITVNNVNRPPVLGTLGDRSTNVGEPLVFTVDASDPDGDAIEYSAENLPSGATFSGQTFSWTPEESQLGTHQVSFTASDGQLQDSETITIGVSVADRAAPTVSNCSPAPDSIQVPLSSLVTLHIADAGKGVDANSVTIKVNNNTVYTGNTTYYSSAYGDCRRSGTSADYAFTYQSSELFRFNRKIKVTVNAGDLAGNTMNEYSYSFRTEMRSFGRNKPVGSMPGRQLSEANPATVRDSSNNIWAVWQAGQTGSRDIYTGKLADGEAGFSIPINITSNDGDQYNSTIAVDDSDKIYAVWQDNRRGNWDIYLSTSSDGSNWSTAIRINDSNDNEVNPCIAIDRQSPNRAYITWQDDRSGNHDIYVVSSNDSFATKTIARVTSDSSNQIQPDIAIDSLNIVYIVWTDERNGSSDIYGAASSSGPWTNVPIVTSASNQSSPVIATEDTGSTIHLLWVDDAATDKDIYYAASNGLPASPLTGSSIIDDSSGADQLQPAIAISGSTGDDLKVFACWQDWRNVTGSSADTDLYFAELSSDSWTNVFVGDDGTNANQSEPAMGIDSYGHPYLVWADSRNSTAEIYYAGSTYVETAPLISQDVSAVAGATVGTSPDAITSTEDVSVVVPSGAYPSDITISISKVQNPQTFELESFTLPYEFSPSGIEFVTPVTITIPYAVSDSGGTPSPYWYNPTTGGLSQQGISDIRNIIISANIHALQFKTTHFTLYLGAEGASGGNSSLSGAGAGCSLSPTTEGNVVEFLLPYIGLAAVMAALKLRDSRNRKARHTT